MGRHGCALLFSAANPSSFTGSYHPGTRFFVMPALPGEQWTLDTGERDWRGILLELNFSALVWPGKYWKHGLLASWHLGEGVLRMGGSLSLSLLEKISAPELSTVDSGNLNAEDVGKSNHFSFSVSHCSCLTCLTCHHHHHHSGYSGYSAPESAAARTSFHWGRRLHRSETTDHRTTNHSPQSPPQSPPSPPQSPQSPHTLHSTTPLHSHRSHYW
jgi:hypothetical protein